MTEAEVDELSMTELRALTAAWRLQQRTSTGMICATLANTVRDPKRKSSPFEPEDFFPEPGHGGGGGDEKEAVASPEDIARQIRRINAMLGGAVVKRKRGKGDDDNGNRS